MQTLSPEPAQPLLTAYATADRCAAKAYADLMENGMGNVWAREVARKHFERSLNEARLSK